MSEPKLIDGGVSIDDRGQVGFINGFSLDGIKRFYWVSNHRENFVRAWHAHKNEAKYVTVVEGEALIGAVKIDNWTQPSKDCKMWRFVLSSRKPSILYIPAGFANGFMNLSGNAKLLFFSTSDIEQSKNDDYRFDARYWDAWTVVER